MIKMASMTEVLERYLWKTKMFVQPLSTISPSCQTHPCLIPGLALSATSISHAALISSLPVPQITLLDSQWNDRIHQRVLPWTLSNAFWSPGGRKNSTALITQLWCAQQRSDSTLSDIPKATRHLHTPGMVAFFVALTLPWNRKKINSSPASHFSHPISW